MDSLYAQLGGEKVIDTIVEQLYLNVLDDDELTPFLRESICRRNNGSFCFFSIWLQVAPPLLWVGITIGPCKCGRARCREAAY